MKIPTYSLKSDLFPTKIDEKAEIPTPCTFSDQCGHPGDIFKNIQLGKDREFNKNVCLVRKTHYQVRGGNANGGGGVPYLHGYLYLLV